MAPHGLCGAHDKVNSSRCRCVLSHGAPVVGFLECSRCCIPRRHAQGHANEQAQVRTEVATGRWSLRRHDRLCIGGCCRHGGDGHGWCLRQSPVARAPARGFCTVAVPGRRVASRWARVPDRDERSVRLGTCSSSQGARTRFSHRFKSTISGPHTECGIGYSCHSTACPAASSASRESRARAIGITGSCVPWARKIGTS